MIKPLFSGFLLGLVLLFVFFIPVEGATRSAGVRVDSRTTYQKITGFGGFVCSPSFGYNHMTTAEIQKLWGKNSEAGYNIMRLYIPSDESGWGQTLATAQLAKSLGLIVFASPWSMPAAWKTNGRIEAKYNDTLSYLKEEYYDDYAAYLNRYVTYLKNNGVTLDAISIQNEPDMQATYAGCMWTPAQIALFLKRYASVINCKVMAPESVGISDYYVNALLEDSVSAQIDIYAGHQYGGIQDGMKKMQVKGKEVWMTEYLINWNEIENTTRNFNWNKDGFTFATELNKAMLSSVNAWIHYASKRYYGMMGDGTNGSTAGVMTKRGYILSHFAKNTIGSTRIATTWKDDSGQLQGSSYLSATGDSVIIMVINPSADTYSLTLDLPFYTLSGKSIQTGASVNMGQTVLSWTEETCRPKVSLKPYTFNTFILVKSSERPASQMTGTAVHPNTIEKQMLTNTAFGTSYKLSGKTVTFDHSNSLISAGTTASAGYLKLNDQYNKLVFRIVSITSPGSFTSANTTLYYVNASGLVNSYNYGTVNFDKNGNTDWVLDISRNVLTDGCSGVIGISNGNWNSILTIRFGDVYFLKGNEKHYSFSGIYSKGDSDLLDCLEDTDCATLDFTATTGLTADLDWYTQAVNKNCLYLLPAGTENAHNNVVAGVQAGALALSAESGSFVAPSGLAAPNLTFSVSPNGNKLVFLPFNTTVPTGAQVFTPALKNTYIECLQVPEGSALSAGTPVLVRGTAACIFSGSGSVQAATATGGSFTGCGLSLKAPAGSFVLNTSLDSVLQKAASGNEPLLGPFNLYCTPAAGFSGSTLPLQFLPSALPETQMEEDNAPYYDLSGRQVRRPEKGIFIRKGKKYLFH